MNQERNASEDLQYGHIVIVSARWLLAIAGFAFLLYRAETIHEVAVGTVGVLAIAVANFWLHTQILMKRPIETKWVYLASAADAAVISMIVGLQGGLESKAFVFYYPAVLCFALVFPRRETFTLTAMVMSLYAIVCVGHVDLPMQLAGDERVLVSRLLTLLAVAAVGNHYRAVEKRRRSRQEAITRVLQYDLERDSPLERRAS